MKTRISVTEPTGREAARPHGWLRESWGWAAVWVAAGAALVRLVVGTRLPLFPDEAYYWEWSRRLAAGYFDHPPAIAFLIRGGASMLGATPIGVRLLCILGGFVASLVMIAIAGRIAGGSAALRASAVLACMPLAAAGLVLATPDAPLLLAGSITFYGAARAIESPPDSPAALRWWLVAGTGSGLALLSKYTAVLIPLAVLVGLAAAPRLRPHLRRPGPWLAAALAVLVFVPVVVWNAGHGWASFAFQLGHGLGRPRGSALSHEAELLGGQAALVSPVLFGLMIIAIAGSLRRGPPIMHLLAAASAVTLGFFVLTALRKRVEPNWPAATYLPATVVLAGWATSRRRRRWLIGGCALGAALVAVVYVQAVVPVLPVPPRRDPIGRAAGWDRIATAAAAGGAEVAGEGRGGTGTTSAGVSTPRVWYAAQRYQEAAELAFWLPDHPQVSCLALSGRPNQYDYWPSFPGMASAGDALVLALPPDPEPHPLVQELSPYFHAVRIGDVAQRERGGVIDGRRVYVLTGWSGRWPATVR